MALDSDKYITYYVDDYIEAGYHTEELYFEGDYLVAGYYEGEAVAPQEAAADLSVAATATADATRLVTTTADFTVNTTTASAAQRTRNSSADFITNIQFTAAAGRILTAEIEVISLFTPTLVADALKNHTAVLDTRFSATAAVDVIAGADVALENLVNLSLQSDLFKAFNSQLTATANITPAISTQLSAQAQLETESTLNATAIKPVEFASDLNTTATVFASRLLGSQRPRDLVDDGTRTLTFVQGKFGQAVSETFAETDYSSDFERIQSIEFFAGATATNTQVISINDPNSSAKFDLGIQKEVGTTRVRCLVVGRLSDGTFRRSNTVYVTPQSGWNHIRAVKVTNPTETFGRFIFYLNGVQLAQADDDTIRMTAGVLRISTSEQFGVAVDEMVIRTVRGVDTAETTAPVPTQQQEFTDQDDIIAVYRFNGDLTDYTAIVIDDSQSLSAQSTLDATATVDLVGSADLNLTAALASTVGTTREFDSTLASTAQLTATGESFTDFAPALSSRFVFTVFDTLFKGSAVTADSEFAIDSAPTRTRDAILFANSEFQLANDTTVFRTTGSNLSSTAALTATLSGTLKATANLDSTVALSADTTLFKNYSSDLNSTAGLAATVGLLQRADSDLNITAEQTVVSTLFKNYAVDLNTTAQQTVDETLFKNYSAALDTTATVTASVSPLRGFASELTSQANITAQADRFPGGGALLVTQANTSAIANFTTTPEINTIALFAPQFQANAQFSEEIILQTEFAQTAQAGAIFSSVCKNTEHTTPLRGIRGGVYPYEAYNPISNRFDGEGSGTLVIFPDFTPAEDNETVFSAGGNTTRYRPSRISFWYQRPANTTNDIIIYLTGRATEFGFSNNSDVFFSGLDQNGAKQTGTITGAMPTDSDWHHYYMEYDSDRAQNFGSLDLWIDGVYQGNATNGATGGTFGVVVLPSSGYYAQIRLGAEQDTVVNNLYDSELGYVFLSDTGTAPGLATPGAYEDGHRLFDTVSTYTSADNLHLTVEPVNFGSLLPDVRISDSALLVPYEQSLTVIPTHGMTAFFEMLPTTALGTFLFVSNMAAVAEIDGATTVIRQGSSNLNTVAELVATAVVEFESRADLNTRATLTVSADRFRTTSSEINSTALLFSLPGALERASADFSATSTIELIITVKPPIRITETLAAQFQAVFRGGLRADANSNLNTTAVIAVEPTEIPPIRAEADLNSTVTVTCDPQKLVNAKADLVVQSQSVTQPVKTATVTAAVTAQAQQQAAARKFTGIAETILFTQGTQLVLVGVVNLDPFRTLVIKSETRELTITQESRILPIAEETRINRIQGYEK